MIQQSHNDTFNMQLRFRYTESFMQVNSTMAGT